MKSGQIQKLLFRDTSNRNDPVTLLRSVRFLPLLLDNSVTKSMSHYETSFPTAYKAQVNLLAMVLMSKEAGMYKQHII